MLTEYQLQIVILDFNSRPSARGDPPRGRRSRRTWISIHAPPRGATLENRFLDKPVLQFQFTPLREGRRYTIIGGDADDYFNSRPSARGDAILCTMSIRGAFQFTPLREGRLAQNRHYKAPKLIFQFTPLREGRPHRGRFNPDALYFNSRPSARGDVFEMPDFSDSAAFQFTPLREGRHQNGANVNTSFVFQFTPLREGRREKGGRMVTSVYFNSRPSARGDSARKL